MSSNIIETLPSLPTEWDASDELTPEETARTLNTTVGTLAVWRSTRRYDLPFVKYPSCIRYLRTDVAAFKRRLYTSAKAGREAGC